MKEKLTKGMRMKLTELRDKLMMSAMFGLKKGVDDKVGITGKVVAVLENIHTGEKRIYESTNIVSDEGDLFYAQRAAEEQPDTDHFTNGATTAFDGIMELGNDTTPTSPLKTQDRSVMAGFFVAGSQKAMDSTYPRTNDPDGDNTGAGTDIVTHRVSYTTGEANASDIQQVIITNPSPGASENILMYATFTAFTKTSSDTLKMFVNHTMNGV